MAQLTGIRDTVFSDRYSLKDEKGKPVESTPAEMWRRVARGIASVEPDKKHQKLWEQRFYQALSDFKFVPGGRILSGAGTGYNVTFYNCFVIPSPADSREGILETLKQMVEIMARGGGVGINLSSLRPRGARVTKVNGFSSGPCNWAELFSVATKDIIQQGGTRRGALMLMLWDWHPDIEEFITVKKDLSRINGANLSVCASDRFMEAVKKNADWELVFPDVKDPQYDALWDGDIEKWRSLGKKVIVHKTVKARVIWDLICEAAWASAEPGLVFMERYNKVSNTWYYERINCVNPCGEQGLPDWGVCNLGALNLATFVDGKGKMDYDLLFETAKIAERFLDNVVDATVYFFDEIAQAQKNTRRTGLGTMGLGDALIKMKVRYGSDASLKIIEKIYRSIRDAAYESSVEIAREKGPFGNFDKKKYLKGKFIKALPKNLQTAIARHGIRNAVILTQAPTGSTSLMSGVSSGIEPVYEFSYIRRDRLGEHTLYHPLFEAWKKDHPKEAVPDYFVSANDLTPEDHVRVQSVIQKYTDSSISKTVNAPNAHTVKDVKKLYTLAYELGCKGITYMRDGSRAGVLTRIADKKDTVKTNSEAVKPVNGEGVHPSLVLKKAPRPSVVHGATYQVQTPVGIAYVTINTMDDQEPLEMFINIGKAGSDVAAMAEALGRIVSLNLRMASPLTGRERIKLVFNELIGIGGSRHLGFGENRVRSLPDALAKAIAKHFTFKVKNGEQKNEVSVVSTNGESMTHTKEEKSVVESVAATTLVAQNSLPYPREIDLCPSCGEASLAFEEGCAKCYSCGHAEC